MTTINELVAEMDKTLAILSITELQGHHNTSIKGVHLFRDSQGNDRTPLLYQSGIIFMLQGTKNIYLDDVKVTYQQGDFVTIGVPLPLECEAICHNNQPILGLVVDATPKHLAEIQQAQTHALSDHSPCRCQTSLKKQHLNEELLRLCYRLIRMIRNPVEAELFGDALVKEIVYRVTQSPHGSILTDLTNMDSHYSRIAKTLTDIHAHYDQGLTVEELAERVAMSVSSFHRAFRQVTLSSPTQYIKQVRLNKARDLIVKQNMRVNDAAFAVGYRSISQFSREYKRYFSATPSEHRQQMQTVAQTA